MKDWQGTFGKDYTKRNLQSFQEMEDLHRKYFGMSRTEINLKFLNNLDRSMKILEVGCNIGNQLLCLQRMGFSNLSGIELQSYAIGTAKSRPSDVRFIQGSIFDLPFETESFDFVFTSNVLIHISPTDINKALIEIHRCTRKYIWGFEYYAKEYTEVVYRGKKNLLWKTDFPKLYLGLFKDLRLVKQKQLKYLNSDNTDIMFLLGKRGK